MTRRRQPKPTRKPYLILKAEYVQRQPTRAQFQPFAGRSAREALRLALGPADALTLRLARKALGV